MLLETTTRPTILLAEDDPNVRDTLADLLALTGALVQAVPGGHEARQVLETRPIDLIVTDMIMPDGDGKWLMDFVRSTPRFSHLRIIMLSAHVDARDVAAGLSAGADAYLTKPFDVEKLLATVSHWLRQPPRSAAGGGAPGGS